VCTFHIKIPSRLVPRYFASVDRGISSSNNFILFLGTCIFFVNITAVLLSTLIFAFHLYSHDAEADIYTVAQLVVV
jgi:hypothetical protein